jgi:hypothetical protein
MGETVWFKAIGAVYWIISSEVGSVGRCLNLPSSVSLYSGVSSLSSLYCGDDNCERKTAYIVWLVEI